jgi:hypothetical protein
MGAKRGLRSRSSLPSGWGEENAFTSPKSLTVQGFKPKRFGGLSSPLRAGEKIRMSGGSD